MRAIETPQGRCRFGIARADITPPVGMYHRMWGAASHDRSTGIHRPLEGAAIYFQSLESPHDANSGGPDRLVLVALDLCLLWFPELDALQSAVCRATGLAKQQVIITFTHTHGAGLIGRERLDMPGGDLIPAYLDSLTERVLRIVNAAMADTRPVDITHGTGRCDLATQRDYWDEATKQFVCGFDPLGTCDDRVLVARVSDDNGATLATLVNYACHPTTLAWQNTLVSPDFPGAMRETVERASRAPCVFFQGASGDVGPREGFVGDTSVADRNGRQLGYAVLSTIEALPPPRTRFEYAGPVVSGATLGTWEHRPLSADRAAQTARWRTRTVKLDLDYRPGLPSVPEILADLTRHEADEAAANQRGDRAAASAARAMAERSLRHRHRMEVLPPGGTYPYEITLLEIGDGIWVFVEGELYNVFQRALRDVCPNRAVHVVTLSGGSRVAYLPPAETYDRGIYQESIALLAAGSLERITAAMVKTLRSSD